MALAKMERSGVTPKRACAPLRPSRKPVITSSKIRMRAMLAAGRQRAFQIAGRGRDGALVAHGGLHDHARDIALGQPRFQPRQIVPADHIQAGGIDRVLAHAARHQHRRIFRPRRILRRRGGPQDIVEPAVIMAFEFQDDAACRWRRAPGGRRPAPLPNRRSRNGCAGREGMRSHRMRGGFEFDLRLAGIENALVDLILDRLLHALGRMAQYHRAHAAIIVDQPVAIGIDQIRALAALEHQRPARHADAKIAVDPAGNMFARFPRSAPRNGRTTMT